MYAIRFRKTLAFPHGVRAGRRVAPVRGGRDVARGSGRGTERTPHPPCGNGSRRRVAGQPAARCTQRPAGRAPSACREIVSEEDPRFSAALCPERTFPMLQPERPVRLSEAVSALLPSWRGLVAFPLPPPRPSSGPGTAFRLLLGAVPSTRLVFPCRFRSGCTVPPDGLFRKASVSRRSSLRLRLAAWRKNAVRPGCPASTL